MKLRPLRLSTNENMDARLLDTIVRRRATL